MPNTRTRRAAAMPILFDAETLDAMPAPAAPPLLEPVLVHGGLTVLRGEIGLGKTWLALSLAHAVASGRDLLGWRAGGAARVLFVDGALRLPVLQARARAVAAGLGGASSGRLRFLAAHNAPLPDLGTDAGIAAMEAMLPSGLGLLVLDGVMTFLPAGRGATQRMRLFAGWIESLRRRGIAVLVVDGPRRAATAVLDERADNVLVLSRPADYLPDEGARVRVRYAVARGLAGAAVRRFELRLAVDGGRAAWTRLDAFDEEAIEAWRMHQAGLTVREIGRRLRVSPATAWRLMQRARAMPPALRRDPAGADPAPDAASCSVGETVKQDGDAAHVAAAAGTAGSSGSAAAGAGSPVSGRTKRARTNAAAPTEAAARNAAL